MLVNYKKANMLTCPLGDGQPKLVLIPGINVLSDEIWKKAEKTLADHIKRGLIVPIYKVTKNKGKDGKETEEKSPVTPDEIPNDQLDAVVNEIQSEAQADKFVEVATKESVRAKAMNRKAKIKEELAEQGNKN